MINYGKQSIDRTDLKKVKFALKSDFLTTGPKVNEFEKAFAKKTSSKYAIAVCNGTTALHLECLAVGIKEGDEVIATP
ncbi:MAG: DegT/DnrJ/EryC1/StrS family aminotransferase, partial [Nanoarchaeota archaeon]|nr:DegT/DnrJ/EryC1/StrS family aminotransferase [Nanoarchaeota archaeon]